MNPELLQITTTTAEKTDAQNLAQRLHEQRLAACTQISGPLESNYRWNNRLETSREWLLTIKTRADLFTAVETLLKELHPYDQPEIIAVPLVAVSEGYRTWVLEQLESPHIAAAKASSEKELKSIRP